MRRLPNRAIALLASLGLVVAIATGCSSPEAASPPPAQQAAVVEINTNTQPGLRAKQAVDMLNTDLGVDVNGVRSLAAADVVDIVQKVMSNMWLDRPFTVSDVEYFAGHVVLHLVNSFGARQTVEIHTDQDGLVNRFDVALDPPVITEWSDIDAALAASQARYSYQVAKVDDGRCDPIAGVNTGESLPLASIFKLYVLYAVAQEVHAGRLSWDEELTITDREKSVEFTGIEEFPLGEKVTVRTAAETMISRSYNTSTDLLINRVGRHAVERALIDAGHHDPQSMTPLPTMYELFSIGWGEPDLRQQWQDAVDEGAQARSRLLQQADSAPYVPDPARNNVPASMYGVEWFGTAEDICRAHAALQETAFGPAAPVRDIMAIVAGIDLDRKQWPYIGAKGGNLPGDLTFSWYAEDRNGQPWVVSFQLNWTRARGMSAWGWVQSMAQQAFALAAKQG